jgi:hypothetical protein
MSQKSWHQLLQSKVDGSIHVVYNSIQTQAIFCSCIGWNLSPSPLYSYGICHHFLFFSIVMIMCFLMELLAMLSACSISSTVILGVTLGNCICSVLLIWNEAFCWTRKYKFPRFWISIENYMQVLKRRWQIRTLLWTRYASSFYVYSSDFPRDKPTWISLTCAVSSRWRVFALSRCELSLLLFFFFNFISCCSSEFRCYHCQKIDNMLWPPCEPNPYFWSAFCGTIAFHVYLLIQHR